MIHAVLVRTRAKLSDRDNWIKGTHATDRDGNMVNPTSMEARCWCLSGAIIASAYDTDAGINARILVRNVVWELYRYEHIPTFNDAPGTTHEQVLRVLNTCIERTGVIPSQEQQS